MHRSPNAWRALTHAAINTALDEVDLICGGMAGSVNNTTNGVSETPHAEEGSRGEPAENENEHSESDVAGADAGGVSTKLAAVAAGGESMLVRLFNDVESVANVAMDDPVGVPSYSVYFASCYVRQVEVAPK